MDSSDDFDQKAADEALARMVVRALPPERRLPEAVRLYLEVLGSRSRLTPPDADKPRT